MAEAPVHCGAVVVAHDRLDSARACVASLRRDLAAERILVVLNDPRSVDVDEVTQLMADATVLSPVRPMGYGANLNLGVSLVPPEVQFCVLANDDVVFEAGSLAHMVDTLAKNAAVAVVGGRLVGSDGSDQVSVMAFPSARGELGVAAGVSRRRRRSPERRAEDPPLLDRASTDAPTVGWVVGAALVVRLQAFREVHGFDEDYFLFYEEVDLCWRLCRAGWLVAACTDAPLAHVGRSSIKRDVAVSELRAARRTYFRKRLRSHWRPFQVASAGAFTLGGLQTLGASVLHPSTAGWRFQALRRRWENRLFL
ncbi:MAG TPA: glycosyltransferase family 2 protein [Gaiellaceae bacterium]|jgi:N-acetylglucosaminyl-diphospho-decaprenol L-rhamnosyltransferase